LNGHWVRKQDARISIFDEGFLSGVAVYETIRTVGTSFFAVFEHWQRLQHSAGQMKIPLPFDHRELESILREGKKRNALDQVLARIQISCGPHQPDIPASPTTFVHFKPLPVPPPGMFQTGVDAGFSPFRRKTTSLDSVVIKTISSPDVFLSRLYRPPELYDWILLNSEGFVAEGTFSNVFFLDGDKIVTPSLETGILSGITRSQILLLAREDGWEAQERLVQPWELFQGREVFLTHTSMGPVPLRSLEAQPLVVSKGFARIRKRWESFLATGK